MDSVISEWLAHSAELLQNKAAVSLFLAGVVALSSILYYIVKMRGLPPGPVGLPILGYYPFLKNETCHLTLQKFQKKYGDIFSFNYAGALYINMGSVKAIRDIHLVKADCFERSADFSLLTVLFQEGIAFVNGEMWKAQRKFALQQFKELGMTTMKENMSGPIYDSIKETIEHLKSAKGEPVEIIQHLTDKCNAILRRTMFGDHGITEQEVREMNESYAIVMSFMSVKNTLHSGNFAKYFILPFQPGYRNAMKHHRNMERILQDIVNRHKSTFNEEHPRNFIDAYFKERNVRRARGDPSAEYFTDRALVANFVQFVGDGVLAVASFVGGFLKYVVDHPEEQEKMYSELIEVVGQDRDPSIEDKNKLPYTNALILEILRISDSFPMFPSQQCKKETTVRGYRIPKGAITLMNTWGCHYNPDTYEEPEKFNPSRYLIGDGKQRPELPVTFGVGKRNCIGEGFTMTQVFLFLTTIIKHFKLSIPESSKTTAFELLMSGKMMVRAEPRN